MGTGPLPAARGEFHNGTGGHALPAEVRTPLVAAILDHTTGL
ncbi:hypothetical protein ACFW9O_33920 [Streptomyces sp. NPDC059499]